jgi:ribonucleoside-diphosphate reductase alpha chain
MIFTTETTRVKTGCGHLYVTLSTDPALKHVSLILGKTGGCAAAFFYSLAKVINLAVSAGVDMSEISKGLKGIGCPSPTWEGNQQILSCSDALSRVIEQHSQTMKTNSRP